VLEDRLHRRLAVLPDDLVLGPVQAQLTRTYGHLTCWRSWTFAQSQTVHGDGSTTSGSDRG